MRPNASNGFVILLCLTPDYFTRQGESAGSQWVNQTICPGVILTLYEAMRPDALYFLIFLSLMPHDFIRTGESVANGLKYLLL